MRTWRTRFGERSGNLGNILTKYLCCFVKFWNMSQFMHFITIFMLSVIKLTRLGKILYDCGTFRAKLWRLRFYGEHFLPKIYLVVTGEHFGWVGIFFGSRLIWKCCCWETFVPPKYEHYAVLSVWLFSRFMHFREHYRSALLVWRTPLHYFQLCKHL